MEGALARHDALARAAVEGHRGRVVKMTGDGMCAAFDDPQDAVAAALEFQQALAELAATGGLALRARCGLHAGIVERRDNDFFGTVLNRAARIMAAAHGGQVLVSQALSVLLVDRLPPGIELLPLGAVRLRDLASPESVFQVLHPSLRREFPALRSLSSTPNNLPAAGDVLHRSRPGAGGAAARPQERTARDDSRRGRTRQDAALAAGGRGRDGRLPGRSLAGRARADRRRPNGAAGGRVGPRGQGGNRTPGVRSADQGRRRPPAVADPRQLRASARGLRRRVPPVAPGRPAPPHPGVEP